MKRMLLVLFGAAALMQGAQAGNRDRQGEAGASELLINPWAASSGWDGLSTANIRGVEALFQNVAGLAFTSKTELAFAHTQWLSGTGIALNTFGFAQSLGAGGVLGANVMSIDFGEIPITTTGLPEGGLGTYSPQFINLAVAYAKEFSNSIYCGILVRGISESIADVAAFGACVDAGIQYVTGPKHHPDQIQFGIAIRNIGTRMTFGGDGLSFRGTPPQSEDYTMTLQHRSQGYELPSLLHIGGSYTVLFGDKESETHRITMVANFTSHSFSQDQIGAGLEYAFRKMVMLRAGYNYQAGLTDPTQRVTALTGFSGGLGFLAPLKRGGPNLGFDYSYRSTQPFNGTHTAGLRIVL